MTSTGAILIDITQPSELFGTLLLFQSSGPRHTRRSKLTAHVPIASLRGGAMEGQERDYGHRRAPARGASAPRPRAKIRHKQVDADSSRYSNDQLTHVIDVLHAAVHTLVHI
jgi:hypothetical protein